MEIFVINRYSDDEKVIQSALNEAITFQKLLSISNNISPPHAQKILNEYAFNMGCFQEAFDSSKAMAPLEGWVNENRNIRKIILNTRARERASRKVWDQIDIGTILGGYDSDDC